MTVFQHIILYLALLSAALLAIAYVLYPLLIRLLARFQRKEWHIDNEAFPHVTMLVSMYNEEKVLPEKLENFFALDYPADRLHLLVASDGSTDATNSLLENAAGNARIAWRSLPRGGKMRAINTVMHDVKTPIVLFSDANTMYNPDAVKCIVRHFADRCIGGVCGNLQLVITKQSVGAEGERTYWAFENRLKAWEGAYSTTLGATGGIYAIRAELFEAHPEVAMVADDFLLPMRIAAKGYRIVYDSDAIAREQSSPNMRDEFRRKVRIARTSFNCLPMLRKLFTRLPFRVQFMFISHKLLRWLGPILLLILAIAALLLSPFALARLLLLYPMLLILFLAFVGWIAELLGKHLGMLSYPFYFLAINAALLVAWVTLPFIKQQAVWEPSKRD